MVTLAKNRIATLLAGAGILVLVALLYGPFIDNPPFLDDVAFFAMPQTYIGNLSWSSIFDTRSVSRATFALTYWVWGLTPSAYRAGNLIFHCLTAFSLFLFVRDLLAHELDGNADLPACGAALLFALHPVAAFAVGYIIERSIVLSGLFSIWMWIAVHRGVTGGRKSWLLLSVSFYFLAVYSKEHAVAALPVALLVAWNAANGELRKTASALLLPLSLWTLTALAIVLRMKHVIGATYEPNVGGLIADAASSSDHLLWRSCLNQSWLFFKYILYWLVPNQNWMAIDLRVPFPSSWFARPWVLGLLGFLAYPAIIVIALWRRYMPRLVGMGLLAPWLLFMPMLSAVMYQEPFVLYRSYLWALPGALPVAVLLSKLARRSQVVALAVVGLFLFSSTWIRLQIFADPVSLWTESVNRLEGKDDLPGAYRSYQHRGVAYAQRWERQEMPQDMLSALADFDKEVQLSPNDPKGFDNRGQAYLALGNFDNALDDFNSALGLNPAEALARFHRGLTLLNSGRREEGLADLAQTCSSYGFGCNEYASLRAQ